MSKETHDNDKAAFILVYMAMVISGGFMGFCGGLLAGWSLWG